MIFCTVLLVCVCVVLLPGPKDDLVPTWALGDRVVVVVFWPRQNKIGGFGTDECDLTVTSYVTLIKIDDSCDGRGAGLK